ncbi:hypothetical protein ACWEKM_27045 [Streptomyces sp. NPDC004752]
MRRQLLWDEGALEGDCGEEEESDDRGQRAHADPGGSAGVGILLGDRESRFPAALDLMLEAIAARAANTHAEEAGGHT